MYNYIVEMYDSHANLLTERTLYCSREIIVMTSAVFGHATSFPERQWVHEAGWGLQRRQKLN